MGEVYQIFITKIGESQQKIGIYLLIQSGNVFVKKASSKHVSKHFSGTLAIVFKSSCFVDLISQKSKNGAFRQKN